MEKLFDDTWLSPTKIALKNGQKIVAWVYNPTGKNTAVFFHGLKGDHAGLCGLAWEYTKKHPKDKIVIVDLPGFGESQALKETNLNNYSKAYGLLLDALESKSYTLIGHSFGALLLYAYLASKDDERVKKVYLFGTLVAAEGWGSMALQFYTLTGQQLPDALRHRYFYNHPLNYLESRYFTKTKDPDVRAKIYDAKVNEMKYGNPSVLTACFDISLKTDLRKLDLKSKAAVTFIHGTDDNLADFKFTEELAKKVDAKLVALAAGHYLVNEQAKECGGVFN